MYARNAELDRCLADVIRDSASDLPEALKWLLSSPGKFLARPEQMGVDDGAPRSGLRKIYADDLRDENPAPPGLGVKILASHPLAFGNEDQRESVSKWETSIWKSMQCCEWDPAELVQKYGSYMDREWNYWTCKKVIDFLEKKQYFNCEDWLTERHSACHPGTRDIEARGGGFTRATRTGNNAGVLKEVSRWLFILVGFLVWEANACLHQHESLARIH